VVTAQRFYALHEAEHLAHDTERLIERCAIDVATVHALSPDEAREAAAIAWDERERGSRTALVDMEASSHAMVVVRDLGDGCAHYLTAGELLQHARARGAAVAPEPDAPPAD